MARYAVYYAPPPGSALDRFGRGWVGRDAWTDAAVDQPSIQDVDLVSATAFPRRYGFHATLKAPFKLAQGVGEAGLLQAFNDFAAGRTRVEAPPLQLATLGDFLALVPSRPSTAVDVLAADCVREFEPLRAPLSEADRQRRLKSALTDRQRAYLEAWGYPYVFDEFTFHMTLTSPLARETRQPVETGLRPWLTGIEAVPFVLDCLVVSKQQAADEPFRIIASHRLPAAED